MARTSPTATLPRQLPQMLGAIIRVRGVPANRAELRLSTGSCIIGAGTGADIIVDDKAVSRKHVKLTLHPEGIQVRDLGSRNGTYYLGNRVEKIILSFGSTLGVGGAEVSLEADTSVLDIVEGERGSYRGLLGRSTAMRKLFAVLGRLEGSLVNVLIEGESGVGKELVAAAIHDGSTLAHKPLVVVNCGVVGGELVRSELFGHRKGSFTGAADDRIGAFDAADGGCLFLDEIGELPLSAQPALLRALESGEVHPVGDAQPHRVKVRVVAATNRDLAKAVEEGTFREDLYYRVAIIKLDVPPLRDRADDVPLLAEAFARAAGSAPLPRTVLQNLASQRWRGNVRELKNAVLAYAALGMLPAAGAASTPSSTVETALANLVDTSQPYADQREAIVALFSQVYFRRLLDEVGGKQAAAAERCGLERSYLGKLLKKYGLKDR